MRKLERDDLEEEMFGVRMIRHAFRIKPNLTVAQWKTVLLRIYNYKARYSRNDVRSQRCEGDTRPFFCPAPPSAMAPRPEPHVHGQRPCMARGHVPATCPQRGPYRCRHAPQFLLVNSSIPMLTPQPAPARAWSVEAVAANYTPVSWV